MLRACSYTSCTLQEVAYWFSKLPEDLQASAVGLAHDDGCVLATAWNLQVSMVVAAVMVMPAS